MKDVVNVLLEILSEAHQAGKSQGASFVLHQNRESAYSSGLRSGLLFDLGESQLISSRNDAPSGISDAGIAVMASLKQLKERDPDGALSAALVSVFLPTK